ncbi:SDR family oxidoreductase [Microbacterium sp. NPDC089318]
MVDGLRTYVVTGAASGIGAAVTRVLESRGHRVLGIDLAGADIDADLGSVEGRSGLADTIRANGVQAIDAIIAVAGVSAVSSLTVRVNYFGAKATVEMLRPLLRPSSPRAVVVALFSTLQEVDDDLVAALEAEDEGRACEIADSLVDAGRGHLIYASTKRAIAEWIRRASIEPEWAGAGIPLNAVGPGVVVTPMTAGYLSTDDGRAAMLRGVPMPLSGPARPESVAYLLAWLTSEENTHVTGQAIFIDGGADTTVRGPKVFDGARPIEWGLPR